MAGLGLCFSKSLSILVSGGSNEATLSSVNLCVKINPPYFPLIPIWTPKLALILSNFSAILPMGFWGLTGNLPVLYHSEKPKLLTFEVDTISLKVKNKLRSRGNLFLTSSVILPLTPPSIMPSNPASFSTDCQILLSCHFHPAYIRILGAKKNPHHQSKKINYIFNLSVF